MRIVFTSINVKLEADSVSQRTAIGYSQGRLARCAPLTLPGPESIEVSRAFESSESMTRPIRSLTAFPSEPSTDTGAELDASDWWRVELQVAEAVGQLMEFWGITRHELELSLRRHPLPVRVSTVVSPVKYRHPVTHLTWNGTGAQPDWLRHALLQEGYTVAQLRLDLPQPCPDPTLCDLSLAMGPGARA